MTALHDNTPVIAGVGDIRIREADIDNPASPLDLMQAALESAAEDCGAPVLPQLNSLDIIAEITWLYDDPAGRLCRQMGIQPKRAVYGVVGGQTPIEYLHEAALRIARGESRIAAVVGGEAQYTLNALRKRGMEPPWPVAPADTPRLKRGVDYLRPDVVKLGIAVPPAIYPLFENACVAAWKQTPREATEESASIWATYARVAASNPWSWIANAPDAEAIRTVTADNRLIAWPYVKSMVANPNVNQSAALILCSLGEARRLGLDENRLIHVWGGSAAQEPKDYLDRPGRFTECPSQKAVLQGVLEQTEMREAPKLLEFYSCFPIVPKMARRELGLAEDAVMTVAGGLSFFGAPLNNYMGHAATAMVRQLRAGAGATGLLYGQGGHMSTHHALVLGAKPSPGDFLTEDYQAKVERKAGPTVELDYRGPAEIETFTILYDRAGAATHGAIVARTPGGARTIARVEPQADVIARLEDPVRSPVGERGVIDADAEGRFVWRFA